MDNTDKPYLLPFRDLSDIERAYAKLQHAYAMDQHELMEMCHSRKIPYRVRDNYTVTADLRNASEDEKKEILGYGTPLADKAFAKLGVLKHQVDMDEVHQMD